MDTSQKSPSSPDLAQHVPSSALRAALDPEATVTNLDTEHEWFSWTARRRQAAELASLSGLLPPTSADASASLPAIASSGDAGDDDLCDLDVGSGVHAWAGDEAEAEGAAARPATGGFRPASLQQSKPFVLAAVGIFATIVGIGILSTRRGSIPDRDPDRGPAAAIVESRERRAPAVLEMSNAAATPASPLLAPRATPPATDAKAEATTAPVPAAKVASKAGPKLATPAKAAAPKPVVDAKAKPAPVVKTKPALARKTPRSW